MYDFDECREIAEDETQVSGSPYAVVQDAEGVFFVLRRDQADNLTSTGRYTVRYSCWITHRDGRRMLVGQLEELLCTALSTTNSPSTTTAISVVT